MSGLSLLGPLAMALALGPGARLDEGPTIDEDTTAPPAREALRWSKLPPLPDTPGLGGPFVGTHGDALIVAGGANFPDGPPWEGGAKVWYDEVYVLEPGAAEWIEAGELETPLAYGVAASLPDGVALLGGTDGKRPLATCHLLRWDPGSRQLHIEPLPDLPRPSAFPAGAVIEGALYVAAGSSGPDAVESLDHSFWCLQPGADTWTELPPWPGPARHKAVAFAQGGGLGTGFYLASGEIPLRGPDGASGYDYRSDAFRFDPAQASWTELGELPFPVAAAAALPVGQSHALVFSGSTGEHVLDPDPRPEFPRRVMAYHTITDTWSEVAGMPTAVVTTGAVHWQDRLVLPSGEVRPGVRTPAVQAAELSGGGSSFGLWNSLVLVAYLAGLVWIGVRFARREEGTSDFFLAGRRIPWWAAGISIFATQLSAITFVSTPAVAFSTDWVVLPGKAMILAMAPIVVLLYLPFFRRLDVTTAYEYLERRFHVAVRLFGSASFVTFQLMRMAIVLFLPALALAAITGIDVYACILVMGILSTLYTALGGMEAVIWTDVLQTVVLVGGMLLAVLVVGDSIGGLGAVLEEARNAGKLRLWAGGLSTTELVSWSMLLGTFALQFGPYTTDQSVVQRYLTTRDEAGAARGVWLNGLLALPVGFLFMLLGACLWAFYRQHPESLALGMQNDEVLPLFVATELPAGLSGLVIAAIFAASMSSLDSSMHSIATAVTVDGYRRFRPGASDASCLRLARLLTVGLGVLAVTTACLLVTFDIRSLWFFFQKCLGLLSSGLVGVFVLGIFTRRASSTGVLVGAAASVLVLVWATWYSDLHFYLYAVIGIPTCIGVGYLASLVLPDRERELDGLCWPPARGR